MRSSIVSVCLYGLGVVAIVCAMGGYAEASGLAPVAPEIDGASLSTGLAAATAAVLILRSRRRSK
jgi:hypothetical protein